MNEKVEASIGEAVAWLTAQATDLADATKTAATWAAGQVPPLISELILVERLMSTASMVAGLAMLAGGAFYAMAVPWPGSRLVSADQAGFALADVYGACDAKHGGAVVLCVLGILLMGSVLRTFAVAWLAPRVFVLEQLQQRLKAQA